METVPKEWVKSAVDLTEEERDRFIILDNTHAGEWDYLVLSKEWDKDCLADWGLEMKEPEPDKTAVSFSARKIPKGCLVKVILDSEGAAEQLAERLIKEGLKVEIK